MQCKRTDARAVARRANWKDFFQSYMEAYEHALVGRHSPRGEARREGPQDGAETHLCRDSLRPAPFPDLYGGGQSSARRSPGSGNSPTTSGGPGIPAPAISSPPSIRRSGPRWATTPSGCWRRSPPNASCEASENASYLSLYAQIFQQFDDYMGDRAPSPQIGPLTGLKWSSADRLLLDRIRPP